MTADSGTIGKKAVCAVLLLIAGCAVGPDFVRPKPPEVDRYTRNPVPTATIPAAGQSQQFEIGAKLVAEWWRLFNSSQLETVLKEALANNPNLQAAQASLRQSQANLRAGYGVFLPQVDASFEANRQKFSSARFGGSLSPSQAGAGTGSLIFNVYTLAGTVNYTLDVFGGERRTVEGLKAQVDFQRSTVLAAYNTLLGNIVNTVIAQAGYKDQIKATEEILSTQREQVRITEAQNRAGTVPYLNVLSLQAQLAATEATLPPLQQRLSQAEHLLATLVGRTPAEWASPRIDLADLMLPENLPITLPSDLVRQRPDIVAAEAQLHNASANIGVATAAMFPSFTLNGTYGQSSNALDTLLRRASNYWSLAADIAAPIFHGGTLWFRRKAAIAAYHQSLADYRQTILSGFSQVADLLRALEHDAETLRAQQQGFNAAEGSLRLIQVNYQAGTVNYLQVLAANTQYYQARIGYLQALAQRLQDTAALFVALGGGVWNDGQKTLEDN